METPKKKLPVIQIVRHIMQLAAFIIYPGLFVLAFLSVKSIYTSLITGTFTWQAQLYPAFIVVAVLGVTLLLGRVFCGFLCSFGALGDLVWFISRHTLRPKVKISPKADGILKYLKYAVLAVIVIFGWTLTLWDFDGYNSPWTVFAMLVDPSSWSMTNLFLTLGFVLLLLIIVGSFFVERFFCRYLCPLGAIFSGVSKGRILRIRKTRKNCGSCSLCTAKCSMGIPLKDVDIVRSGECINCFQCTEVCPRRNAVADPQPLVTAAIAVAATSGLVYMGSAFDTMINATSVTAEASAADSTDSAASSSVNGTSSAGSTSSASSASQSTDGTGMVVAPEESTTDNTAGTADSTAGTTDNTADNTTGTTNNAADTASTADNAAGTADSTAAASSGQYADGTYSGSGTGLRGETDVTVTVEGGQITSIEIVSYQDDSQYFNRAKNTIISEILEAQGIDVSTVSGATFSSNGIIEAVANALGVDFTNPNSTMQMGPGGH